LPTCIREDEDVGVRYVVSLAYLEHWALTFVGVKLDSVGRLVSDVAKEPEEGFVVFWSRSKAGLGEFADDEEDIGSGVEGKVEYGAYG
jgi:hypothetical protein